MTVGTHWRERWRSGALFLIVVLTVACGPLPDRQCWLSTKGGATCITVRHHAPPVVDGAAQPHRGAE